MALHAFSLLFVYKIKYINVEKGRQNVLMMGVQMFMLLEW